MRHVGTAARALATAMATAMLFAAALLAGALVHLDAPAVHRVVAARVNAVLAAPLEGKIVLERIGFVGLKGVDGVDARVEDPDGVTVLRARGIHAGIDLEALLRSLAAPIGAIAVSLHDVAVAEADVNLDADAAGRLRLARAFEPRPTHGGPPGRDVNVTLPSARVAHATVHGRPAGSPAIDAEVDDTDASVSVAPPKVAVALSRARVVVRSPLPAGKDARGDVEGRLAIPATSGSGLLLGGTFRGTVGTIETRASATFDDRGLDASVDVPAAAGDAVRALLPAWPLSAPLALHVEARGPLPRLDVRLHAALEAGSLDVTGPVVVAPLGARLRVEAHAIDPHGIVASVPPSQVTAAGDLTVASTLGGALTAHLDLDVASGKVGALRTPPIVLAADLSREAPPSGAISAKATASIREPGAPMQVSARIAPSRGALVVSYTGSVRADRLEDVPMLKSVRNDVRGRAAASVHGTFDLRSGRVDADVVATTEAAGVGPVGVAAIHAEAHLSGPVAEPEADLTLAAEGLDAPAVHLSTVQSKARFEITRGAFHDLDLRVDEAGEEVRVRAGLVRVAGGELRLDDAVVEGLGEPVQATVHAAPSNVSVSVAGPSIDLARVARFAHWPWLHGGRVGFDVESTITHGATDAMFSVELEDGSLGTLDDVEGRLGATLHGRQITGLATAHVGDIGTFQAASDALQLGGHALDPQAWRRAWGAIDADVHVDLAKAVGVLPPGVLPLDELRGVLDVNARFERDSASDVTPAISVAARTTGLALFGHRASGATWSYQGIDPTVKTTVDGQTGDTTLSVQLHDPRGTLVALDASSKAVPWAVLLLGGAPLLPALEAMPFDARLEVPARRLETFPHNLLVGPTGEAKASVEWHGAASQPTVDAVATLTDAVFDTRFYAFPADIGWKAHYDGAKATSSLEGAVRGHPAISVQGSASLRLADVFAGLRGADLPWTATLAAQVTSFPINGIASLDDRAVRGRATGTITVERLHEDARASVALTFDGLKVGDLACRSANLDATVDGHAMHASASVDHVDGSVTLDARAGAHWGRALVPAIDASQAASLSVKAKDFRAALLSPLTTRIFSDLDGRVDGEASVTVDPESLVARPRGSLALRDGSFELNQLGGEFTGVSGKLVLSPDGVLRLEDLRANAMNGVLTAAATARLDGLAFGGARVTVDVPRAAPLPIVFDGVMMGTMDGKLDASIAEVPGHKGLHVDLDVPELHVLLPSEATRDVQSLGDLPNVRTGILGGDGAFVSTPLDPAPDEDDLPAPRAPIQVAVKLGKDVQVKRVASAAGQADLAVWLEGDPSVTIADAVHAAGQIELVHGTIGVGGKPFEIERGTVAFVGDDPTNPQVVLSAGWTAQDGTRVTASFVGPLKTGKVTLHADPAPPGGQNAILALILFGSVDQDANGGGAAQSYSPAAGFAGAEATAPINRALGGVNNALERFGLGGGISTKVDTTQSVPRPEVELQVARDISVEVAWVLGLPPPGLPDTTLVTFNWRFLRKWSLLTTVGNTGTSILDVVWQHRY